MNILAYIYPFLAYDPGTEPAALMPKIIFWILLLLCTISMFCSWNPGPNANPYLPKINGLVTLILFAILGYYTFRF
jgi:hypothetical protein